MAAMIKNIKSTEFKEGQIFNVANDQQQVKLTVKQVDLLKGADSNNRENREPFSLLLMGDKDINLEQGLYRVEVTGCGELELFMVPLGPDDNGMIYEIVFN